MSQKNSTLLLCPMMTNLARARATGPAVAHVRRAGGSSGRWTERQRRDPYAKAARANPQLKSRAAFKLLEINARHKLLTSGGHVVDLGSYPGGWAYIAREAVGAGGAVVAVDLQDMAVPPCGVEFVCGDATDPEVMSNVLQRCGGRVDVVLSDMSPKTSGDAWLDHVRIMELCHAGRVFACDSLRPGGSFLCKIFRGEDDRELQQALLRDFSTVKTVKPKASRKKSPEAFMLATGFFGCRTAAQ